MLDALHVSERSLHIPYRGHAMSAVMQWNQLLLKMQTLKVLAFLSLLVKKQKFAYCHNLFQA